MPVPDGKTICERQLYNMIEKVSKTVVNDEQINQYMDKAYSMLEGFSKEELIKRFVAAEFNRFVEYYNNSGDLNLTDKDFSDKKGDAKFSKKRRGQSMSRVIFNLGKGKGLSKIDVIDLMVSASGRKDLEIGQIEIFKRASSVEVESKHVKKLLSELNRRNFKGVSIEAEENYEFTGNDFRDRKKGPRGKKRKY
jgi:ATP-dependent RNA helicase DeaD